MDNKSNIKNRPDRQSLAKNRKAIELIRANQYSLTEVASLAGLTDQSPLT